ncbi:MAG TPA: PRC-barrel domain-containing protein [Stellaceae bacterium]|jgi:sporulation protein YlmC with PRC-barrel domain|nr:PRC-barrel domain-containing protein [Stellaceae bacterium]
MDASGKEIGRLISSDKVGGTSVENTKGENLGHIRDVMIDKISGQVAYAVLKYGSVLGMGGKLFALPWDQLKYDTGRGAYIVNVPEDRLRGAPSFEESSQPNWSDPGWNRSVHDYYASGANWFATY